MLPIAHRYRRAALVSPHTGLVVEYVYLKFEDLGPSPINGRRLTCWCPRSV